MPFFSKEGRGMSSMAAAGGSLTWVFSTSPSSMPFVRSGVDWNVVVACVAENGLAVVLEDGRMLPGF